MFVRPGFLRPPSAAPASATGTAHKDYGTGNIHELFNWVAANAAAKTAIVPVAGDLYKALWQSDTSTIYILTSVSPVTWAAVSGSGGSGGANPPLTGPAFYAWQNVAQNIPANTTTKINYQVKVYDTDNAFSTVNSSFTCPAGWGGVYNFSARLGGGTVPTVADIKIRKNGVELLGGTLTNASAAAWHVSGDLELVPGDVVDVSWYGPAITSTNAQLNTWFQGHFVRVPTSTPSSSGSAPVVDKARMSKTTAQNTTANTAIKVLLNNVSHDTNGLTSTANNRINILKPGKYDCKWRVSASAASVRFFASVHKNGSEAARGIDMTTPTPSSTPSSSGSDVISCVAGDYLELYIWCSAAISLEAFDFTTFLTVTGPI